MVTRSSARFSTAQAEFLAGIRAELPIVAGVIPFGIIFGVLALAAGLPPLLAQAMSSIIFAGSAQFIAVQLIGAGVPAVVLLLTTFIVNLHHLLYSASMAPHCAICRLCGAGCWLIC